MVGGFGAALIFICTLVLMVMLGFNIAIHLATGFFTTLEQTAAGSEDVTWPDEPLIDQFGKPFYLVFLFGAYLVPVHLITRLIVAGRPAPVPTVAPLAADLVGLWLVVPVGLLSVLSSVRWVPLRPAILSSMLQRPVTTFVYFVLNGIVVGLLAGVVWVFVNRSDFFVGLGAGPVLAALWLIYARLLGRFGRLLPPPPEEDEEESEAEEAGDRPRARRPQRTGIAVSDPWAAPATAEDQYLATRTPREEAYDVQTGPPPEPAPAPQIPREDPYAVGPAEERPPVPVPEPPAEESPRRRRRRRRPEDEPAPEEEEVKQRYPIGPPPTLSSLWSGVFGYPWASGSVVAWLWLSLGLGIWFALFQFARSAVPG